MHEKGHIGLSLLFVAPFVLLSASEIGVLLALSLASVSVIAGGLPDYDQKLPWVSHRGITHTIWAAFVVTALSSWLVFEFTSRLLIGIQLPLSNLKLLTNVLPKTLARLCGIGVFLGYLSHLFGDMMTIGSDRYGMNVEPFYPLSDVSLQLGITRADSKFWNMLLFGLGSAAAGSMVALSL